jgi:hypothetical protein
MTFVAVQNESHLAECTRRGKLTVNEVLVKNGYCAIMNSMNVMYLEDRLTLTSLKAYSLTHANIIIVYINFR